MKSCEKFLQFQYFRHKNRRFRNAFFVVLHREQDERKFFAFLSRKMEKIVRKVMPILIKIIRFSPIFSIMRFEVAAKYSSFARLLAVVAKFQALFRFCISFLAKGKKTCLQNLCGIVSKKEFFDRTCRKKLFSRGLRPRQQKLETSF